MCIRARGKGHGDVDRPQSIYAHALADENTIHHHVQKIAAGAGYGWKNIAAKVAAPVFHGYVPLFHFARFRLDPKTAGQEKPGAPVILSGLSAGADRPLGNRLC